MTHFQFWVLELDQKLPGKYSLFYIHENVLGYDKIPQLSV